MIVWVSTDIREEHRQALDWLNQRTDTKTDFFGVVIEIIRVGQSKPAIQFRVVVSPNEWQKASKKQSVEATSERSEKYRQYFQVLIDDLREQHRFTAARKGQPQNWYTFSSGDSRFVYGHKFANGGRASTEIYIDSGDAEINEELFQHFLKQKEVIEAQIGSPLEWEKLEGKRACRVALYRDGSIEDSDETLQEIRDWAVQNLLKFKKIFTAIA